MVYILLNTVKRTVIFSLILSNFVILLLNMKVIRVSDELYAKYKHFKEERTSQLLLEVFTCIFSLKYLY